LLEDSLATDTLDREFLNLNFARIKVDYDYSSCPEHPTIIVAPHIFEFKPEYIVIFQKHVIPSKQFVTAVGESGSYRTIDMIVWVPQVHKSIKENRDFVQIARTGVHINKHVWAERNLSGRVRHCRRPHCQ